MSVGGIGCKAEIDSALGRFVSGRGEPRGSVRGEWPAPGGGRRPPISIPTSARDRPGPAQDILTRRHHLAGVLVAAFACVAALVPTPASAQTTVWSATLTPQTAGAAVGCNNSIGTAANFCSNTASLSDDDFSHGGTNYTIIGITAASGGIYLIFGQTIATASQNLTFHVGSTSLRFQDADVKGTDRRGWLSGAPTLTVGTDVSVSLTETSAPGAPTGLRATAVGQTRIDLSWSAPANNGGSPITGYRIEVSPDGSSWSDLVADTGSASTSYSHTGLSPGATRHYRVSAINSVGTGNPSNIASATAGAGDVEEMPLALSEPTVSAGKDSLTVSWDAPPNTGRSPVRSYDLRYREGTSGTWIPGPQNVTTTSATISGLRAGATYQVQVRATNDEGDGPWSPLWTGQTAATAPDAPRKLRAVSGDGAVTLSWDAPLSDGGAAISDYEYQIDGEGEWISIGSTKRTHTISGLTNGTVYVFRVRAVNRIGPGQSRRVTATAGAVLNFAHFANGAGVTSEVVFVNVSPQPTRPALYFRGQAGDLIDPASLVDVTGDLVVDADGGLTVHTELAPQGELTIATHGRGELLSGSLRVVSGVPVGGLVRYSVPGVGVAGVGASPAVRDVLFPARRQEQGIRTAAALHNPAEEALGVSCRLMSGGVALEEVEIPLEANGQTSWFIEEVFTAADTSDFLGAVRCTVPGNRRFHAIAVETDAARRLFSALPLAPVDRTGGSDGETVLDFAHFANGTWITDLVFVNLSIEAAGRPPLTPFHPDILPSRPEIYFYDTEGALLPPASLVDLTDDLEITEDGALTVRAAMEPLGVLTISPHGRGELVTGPVRVVSEGPIGGMLRFAHPALGVVAGVGAGLSVSDALFPVRRREGGINTGVALHNLESSSSLLRCELLRQGVLLDSVSTSLAANGQTSWTIDQAFPATDTSDFTGSLRCSASGGDLFTAVAVEMDPGIRTFTTLPVLPVPETPSRE